MQLASRLSGVAKGVYFMDKIDVLRPWLDAILLSDVEPYRDKKVTVRAHPDISAAVFTAVTNRLMPIVHTLLYGEAGLPKVIYKRK